MLPDVDMPKLSKKIVDASKPGNAEYFVWDGDLPGFGLRVFPSGKKSFLVQYRHQRRTRRITIGLYGPLTPDSARVEAINLLAKITKGGDPSGDRAKARTDLTVAQLCDLYLREGCKSKKPSTVATDNGRILRHVIPLIGHLPVRSVTRLDIQRFAKDVALGKTAAVIKTKKRGKARVTGGAGAASRTLGLLGGIFTFAIKHAGLIENNPVHGVEKHKDKKLNRFLSMSEIQSLGNALKILEEKGMNPVGIAAIRVLILTGCRRSEVLKLTWSEIDWSNSCLRLNDSKTGAKVVPIGSSAIAILSQIKHWEGSKYVFPAMRGTGHYVGIQKDWNRVKTEAALLDVRLHDLRRTFASTAALQGQSLITIGKLLGHIDPKTTQIYAHLTEATIQTAANSAAKEIWERLNGGFESS